MCLLQYEQEENCVITEDTVATDPIFALFSCDLSGIQSFIYNITSKGALKSQRSRSFLLDLLMEHLMDEILEALGLSRANLIIMVEVMGIYS